MGSEIRMVDFRVIIKIIAAVLLVFITTTIFAQSLQEKPILLEQIKEKTKQEQSIKAGLRSLVLPAWGQFYNKQPTKGIIIACSEITLISGAVATYYISDAYYNIYNTNPKGESEKYYNLANDYHYISDYFTLSAVAIWTYAVVDAYIVGKKREKETTVTFFGKQKLRLKFNISNEYLYLAFSKYF